jgi:hypothetical protein
MMPPKTKTKKKKKEVKKERREGERETRRRDEEEEGREGCKCQAIPRSVGSCSAARLPPPDPVLS